MPRLTLAIASSIVLLGCAHVQAAGPDAAMGERFDATVKPFFASYCVSCHGGQEPDGDLDLTRFTTLDTVVKDQTYWPRVIERLQSKEMPPKEAEKFPTERERQQVIDWLREMRSTEARKHAGDPGVVLARRLSNEEYNYTVRDLTGVDLRPTREFPVDPSNTAGFDNSGESLVMSPALLDKYLKAARSVAGHMYLKRSGIAFAPHPMLVETDRDKFCVMQIIDLYHRQNTNYADYFEAAWQFKHRAALGKPGTTLNEIATERKVSAKYLATIWGLLEAPAEPLGPVRKLQTMWLQLPAPSKDKPDVARRGCEEMRDWVVQLRKKVECRFLNIEAGSVGSSRQPMLIWKNVQYATHRLSFDPNQLQVEGEPPYIDDRIEPGTTNGLGPGKTARVINKPGDPDLFVPKGQRAEYEAAFAKFCSVFPDMFVKEERGRNYFATNKDKGRYLSAGFHNLMGYFRDDAPLYQLILDEKQQAELDEMWRELDFIANANVRTYIQFTRQGNRGEGGQVVASATQATEADRLVTAEAKIRQLEARYLKEAEDADEVGIQAIHEFFDWTNAGIRWVERARVEAEPKQLESLLDFAARAYRRPLTTDERDELLSYYRAARERDRLDHESAIRDTVVFILMSPELSYRVDLVAGDNEIHPLSDYDLASRLSYFLWSSMPDAELLAHAAAGDLHKPDVIAAQARRMLKDSRVRALVVEFGGNWLDFRRFQDLNTVDRERFSSFSNELRDAMFEEPVRFLLDVIQNNRSVLDCLYGSDTFVNPVLAKHYGMRHPTGSPDEWVRVIDADHYDRGGILPMAVFLTKNAPGLRTSPVKRGNWVVKNVLGERIPPPPPVVPEIPKDESKLELPLRDVLARHREDPSCAACHARFDSLGLVFEGFGPVGERRQRDLADRPVDARATFPSGDEGSGVSGLRKYIRDRRQEDFVDNLCAKLLVYALGRSPILSDELLVQEMQRKLAAGGYQFDILIESIVTSPQFLNKRGRADLAER